LYNKIRFLSNRNSDRMTLFSFTFFSGHLLFDIAFVAFRIYLFVIAD